MPARSEHLPLLQRFAALGDVARLRLLRLLDTEELSVGELADALQLPQSTVSRHLKLLHEGGWITKRSAGTASLYRVAEQSLPQDMRELWTIARTQLDSNPFPALAQDDARLAEVLAARRTDSKSFFGQIGSVPGGWDALRRELFGESFTAEALLSLVHLFGSTWTVADIGCGTGNAAELLAPLVKKVIAIDREPAMLDAAKKRLAGFKNVEFRGGELSTSGVLPLKNGEVDGALLFLLMIHMESPADALKEIARGVKHGGFVMLVDLVPHDRESYHHTMAHRHLGFDEKQVKSWAKHAGLDVDSTRYRTLRPSINSKGPGLFVATMRKRE